MIVSYQWLLEYLPQPIPVAELSRILTAIGLEVEAVEKKEAVRGGLEGLLIGQVLSAEPHPNADKLKITSVSIGEDAPLQIVCGAPNVATGQKVVVAPVGATVHPSAGEPFLIRKAKIRGTESAGMICAEDEIGLGAGHEGILVLPEDAPVGLPASEFFNLPAPDYAIHIGLTPNRSDANSHIGVARDLCAYLTHHTGTPHTLRLPEIPAFTETGAPLEVQVLEPAACPRYMGLSLEGVRVGPSPDWLRQRLETIGVRSINNVVDSTNYILHEWGQPLHAFDADRIGGQQIKVRFPEPGSLFTTLDGQERKLQEEDLMICDAEQGLCIAGIFGGQNSGVSEQTTRIFLESAYFDPKHIRRSSLHHELRTDAATHFEKGVDINQLQPALLRAAALITEVAGGKVSSSLVDIYPIPFEPVRVRVSFAAINQLTGSEYAPESIMKLLQALGFGLTETTEAGCIVTVPSDKPDVLLLADVVEEILRIDGLDRVAIPERLNISLKGGRPNDRAEIEKIAQSLCGMGFQEIITNSIVNSAYYPDRTDLVRMLNSLSSELDVMRPSLLESGLEVIAYNANRKNTDLLLFESGHSYRQEGSSYIQEGRLALFCTGNAQPAHWNGPARKADLYFLKGVIQNLLKTAGITNTQVAAEATQIVWKWKNGPLVTLTQVHPARLQLFDIRQEVCFAELDWQLWMKAMALNRIQYAEVPRFPAVQRDLAIVVDQALSYQQVQRATDKLRLPALQSYELFDVFESDKIGAGRKSLALSFTFQLQDRTLTDADTEALMQQLTEAYRKDLQAQIRE